MKSSYPEVSSDDTGSNTLRFCSGGGFIRLVDSMGSDTRVVQAARVSYGQGTKTPGQDARLIDYLMRNGHTSPFEKVVFEFHVRAPIFTVRQWMRHRTGSFNEISARYTKLPDEFYLPPTFHEQGTTNKQGSGEPLQVATQAVAETIYKEALRVAYDAYRRLLDLGVSREEARMVLPVSTMTEFYWTVNLHNLLHFVKLRAHPHAQANIREYAEHALDLARTVAPVSVEAWERHWKGRER